MLAEAFFWFLLVVIAYVFVGYPLVLWLLSLGIKAPVRQDPEIWPTVSLIISAYNEELVIAQKLDNSLALHYLRNRLDVVVASDASFDRTDAIAQGYADRGVRLVRVEERQGKTSIQNQAVATCSSEILVFSDANAMYDLDALNHLVCPFLDPAVGVVEGRRLDHNPDSSAVGNLELTYRDYESWIKLLESRVATCTGATGPIYAVRRASFVALSPDTIGDLMEPILIRYLHGLKHVFEPRAISREEVLSRMANETARKVRIMTRCLSSITQVPGLLNPLRNGLFSLQIWSHRLLRWLLPVFWLPHFLLGLFLLDRFRVQVIMAIWLLFLVAAGIGYGLDKRNLGQPIFRMPYYLFSANRAAWIAFLNWLRGRRIVTWSPDRRP